MCPQPLELLQIQLLSSDISCAFLAALCASFPSQAQQSGVSNTGYICACHIFSGGDCGAEHDFNRRQCWAGPQVLTSQWQCLFGQDIDAGICVPMSLCSLSLREHSLKPPAFWHGKIKKSKHFLMGWTGWLAVFSSQFLLQRVSCYVPLGFPVIRMVEILLLGLKRDQFSPIISGKVLCVTAFK